MAQIASTIGLLSGAFISSIGALYLFFPTRAAQGLGLPIPQPVEMANNWFRIKGIRDVVSGIVLMTSIVYAPRKVAGMVTILGSLIPFGDAWIVWAARGQGATGKAGPHVITGVVVLLAGVYLALSSD